jgi:tetratricopeptide (TPR) repeat protein
MAAADGDEWTMRLNAAVSAKDHNDAAQSLSTIAEHWPDALKKLEDNYIAQIVVATPKTGSVRYELLKALWDAHFTRKDGGRLNRWWCELALLQLERGEQADGLASLQAVDSPEGLISVLADNRYAPVRSQLRPPPDVAGALQREIDSADAAISRDDSHLAPVLRLAGALSQAGRQEVALERLDAIIASVRAEPDQHKYADYDQLFVWVLNERSHTLRMLGRFEEALSQMSEASHLPENKSNNVSQVINLAELYNDVGRPREALSALEGLGTPNLSPYGAMQIAAQKLDSALQLKDKAFGSRQLDYLREHRSDSLATYQWALVDANRIDDAAQLLKERLENPEERADALADVQHYADSQLPQRVLEQKRRWLLLLERPDVRDSILKVGAVGSYPITGGPY